jgi:hypothetical protein
MLNRAVFTLAAGTRSYFKMALNLARSFERWNLSDDLHFFIVTDLDLPIPVDLKQTALIKIDADRLPRGFSAKLELDRLQPARQCLFLDADCLVMGPIEPIFTALRGKAVGVLGDVLVTGEWFGDVEKICKKLSIPWMPRFNGGVYYIEKGESASAVFAYARDLEKLYDATGFVRLRGQPADEVLISAALARHNITPTWNDGRYYADFQWWPVLKRFNIGTGDCLLCNPPLGEARHQSQFPADAATPTIIHFLGHHVTSVLYRRSALELMLRSKKIPGSGLIARMSYSHLDFWNVLKDILRPVYWFMFGPRRVKQNNIRYYR